MGFCFGFISNDSAMTALALSGFKDVLRFPEGAPHGWGMAYYQAGQPLLRKQPKMPAGPLDFTEASANLRTNLIIGHVRDATVGGPRTENTHPFRYRSWVFCHSGTIDRFDRIRDDMLRSVPDFIRRNIRGSTDSEHLFHLFLSFLNDTGKLDDPRIGPDVAAQALGSTFAYVDRLVADQGGTQQLGSCVISNGSLLVATRRGLDLKAFRQSAYTCLNPEGKPVPCSHLRAVMLIGGTTPSAPGWEEVADRAIVTVDSRLNISHSTM
jgi:predicted glutamine amidotransferase